MVGQVSVLEGDLPQPYPLRLLNDGVLDLPELLLLGQLFLLSGFIVVVALYLTLEDAPLVVALFHYRKFLQPVHYLVHGFLDGLGQVAVGLLTLDRLQLSGQLLHLLPDLRSRADALRHLTGQTSNGPASFPHQLIPRLGFLLISVQHLLFEYLIHQPGLDLPDAFFCKIGFFRHR